MLEVFVYGSLRRGEPNHGFIEPGDYLGRAVTAAEFTLYDLGTWPGLVRGGTTAVHGECYAVDAALLQTLDEFEGAPELYRRERIALAQGRFAEAWIYQKSIALANRIEGGDWVAYRATRR